MYHRGPGDDGSEDARSGDPGSRVPVAPETRGEAGCKGARQEGKGNRVKRGRRFGERENGEGFQGKGKILKGKKRLRETERQGERESTKKKEHYLSFF